MFYAIKGDEVVASGTTRNEVLDGLPSWIEDGEAIVIVQKVGVVSAETQRIWKDVK